MAFFHQLIANLEHAPAWQQDVQARGGAVSEVLKFAPKRMRPQHRTAEDRINQLETEIKPVAGSRPPGRNATPFH